MTKKRGVGQPRKHSPETLKAGIDKYFRSISYMRRVKDPDTGEFLTDDNGEYIKTLYYFKAPARAALCVDLGIDKVTLSHYGDPERNPDLAPIVAEAMAKLESYLETELNGRETQINGVKFNLENNYGWRQKSEIELGEETRKAAAPALSLSEKIAAIATAQAIITAQGNGDGASDEA